MTKYLAGVLTVIAAGVLLIAYGLLTQGAAAFDARSADLRLARPVFADEQLEWHANPSTAYAVAGRPRVAALVYDDDAYDGAYDAPQVRPVRSVSSSPAPQRRIVRRTIEKPRRNWKKTALVIGGSSAAGAGLGAIIGGRKGALIGAAIGGGASTIYETSRNK